MSEAYHQTVEAQRKGTHRYGIWRVNFCTPSIDMVFLCFLERLQNKEVSELVNNMGRGGEHIKRFQSD